MTKAVKIAFLALIARKICNGVDSVVCTEIGKIRSARDACECALMKNTQTAGVSSGKVYSSFKSRGKLETRRTV